MRPNASQADAWFIADKEVAPAGLSVIDKAMVKHSGIMTLPRYEDMAEASTLAGPRLDYMDSVGVGCQILYPNVIGFGAQALMHMNVDEDLRLWHVQTYNDAIADLQREGRQRLLPQAALPLWNMEATLAELDRIRKLGLTGIAMSNSPERFGQPALTDLAWDRFFATCQDLGLPINFHIGSGDFYGDLSKWWGTDKEIVDSTGRLNEPLGVFFSSHLFMEQFHDIANLILTGVLERFPKLNFVSVESGCGWVPFAMQAIEYQWKELLVSERFRKNFRREPREMFLEQIYVSYWFEGATCVDAFIREFGSANLMFETDFPHPTGLYPGVREGAEATLGHHSRDIQEAVLYKNAERIYGVNVPSLGAKVPA